MKATNKNISLTKKLIMHISLNLTICLMTFQIKYTLENTTNQLYYAIIKAMCGSDTDFSLNKFLALSYINSLPSKVVPFSIWNIEKMKTVTSRVILIFLLILLRKLLFFKSSTHNIANHSFKT